MARKLKPIKYEEILSFLLLDKPVVCPDGEESSSSHWGKNGFKYFLLPIRFVCKNRRQSLYFMEGKGLLTDDV